MRRYISYMLIQTIREMNNQVPFEPYEIHMVSGERYPVPHRDFIAISPRGSFVYVVDAKDHSHHLSALLIERVSPIRRTGGRRKAKKRA
jgi:hypothetical protein